MQRSKEEERVGQQDESKPEQENKSGSNQSHKDINQWLVKAND